MPSKSEQDVGSTSEELLSMEGTRVGHPRLLPFTHSCAHHVPGCEGSGHQTQEREGTVVLEGGKQDCQERHQSPHDGPSPVQLTTLHVRECCMHVVGFCWHAVTCVVPVLLCFMALQDNITAAQLHH